MRASSDLAGAGRDRVRVGIDIGGTKIDAVVLDDGGTIRRRTRRPTERGNAGVIDGIAEAIAEVLHDSGVEPWELAQVGVGMPGVIDRASGRVRHAVNLDVVDLDLVGVLSRRLGAPVALENDVNAAALGAVRLLGLEEPTAYLNVGTGLAAGMVVSGRIWRGARGGAGEIGHIPVDPAGPVCPCGQRGCLETLASGAALTRAWPTAAPYPARDLFDHADAGNPDAVAVRARFIDGVASAVRVLVLAGDVETVIVGGGLSNLGERLLTPVQDRLRRWADDSPFLRSLTLEERTRLLPAGAPAAAIGAALLDAPPLVART